MRNEGEKTWSVYDVIGHLSHGERADWMPRVERILKDGESKAFDPFDRWAQERESKGKSLSQLLATWAGHDLTHVHQISRVMAHQYEEAVGPWRQYLGVLKCDGHSE